MVYGTFHMFGRQLNIAVSVLCTGHLARGMNQEYQFHLWHHKEMTSQPLCFDLSAQGKSFETDILDLLTHSQKVVGSVSWVLGPLLVLPLSAGFSLGSPAPCQSPKPKSWLSSVVCVSLSSCLPRGPIIDELFSCYIDVIHWSKIHWFIGFP